MRRLPLVLTLLSLGGCQDEPKKKQPSAEATASATATPEAAAPEPAPPKATAPVALTSLPPGAMVYGRLDMTLFRAAFDLMPEGDKDEAIGAFEKLTGAEVDSADAFAKALGLDVSRPVLFAAVGPEAAPMEALAGEMAKVKTKAQRTAIYDEWDAMTPPSLVLGRLIVPLGEAGSAKLLAALGDAGEGKVLGCPKAAECASLPGAKHILKGRGEVAAVYPGNDALVIEGVTSYREEARDAALKALAAFRTQTGGPAAETCTQLATTEGTALCLVGDPAEEAGIATGLAATLRAVSANALELKQVAEITEVGTKEALEVRAIAAQKPTFLEDGTFSIHREGDARMTTTGSWRVADEGTKALDAYAKKTCAKGSAEAQAALTKLGEAMGVKGGDAKALNDQIRRAGWGGLVVAMEGAWPAYVPAMNEALGNLPGDVEVCVERVDDRLKITTTFDAATLIK